MARFTLLITAWKKHTKENWVTLQLEWFTERLETQRVRKTLPLSHEVQSGLPCFLNSFSERSLSVARSKPSLRLGQRFMSKGLYMQCFISINSACNQSYQDKIKVTTLQGYARYRSLAKDLLLVKGLSASRSNLERCSRSRGDHRHAATLPSRGSSKKAHLGCHI